MLINKELRNKSIMESAQDIRKIAEKAIESINLKIENINYEDKQEVERLIKKEITKVVSEMDILELQRIVYHIVLTSITLPESTKKSNDTSFFIKKEEKEKLENLLKEMIKEKEEELEKEKIENELEEAFNLLLKGLLD